MWSQREYICCSAILAWKSATHSLSYSLWSHYKDERTHTAQFGDAQLAIKDSGSHSWFVWLGKVADIYGIDLHAPLFSHWPKHQWKQYANNTVTTHWYYKLLISATDKSSLQWISHASLKLGQCHPISDTCPKSVHQIKQPLSESDY